MIYLDNSSTTKPYNEVLNVYEQTSSRYFGNPSSLHRYGAETEQLLQAAKNQIKRSLGLKNMILYLRQAPQKPIMRL